jgi:hypothetical protein
MTTRARDRNGHRTLARILLGGLAVSGLIWLLGPGAFTSAIHADNNLAVVTNVTRTGEIPADIKSLEVDNRFGPLRIDGQENARNEWTWTLTVHARTEALAAQAAAGASCRAERDGGRLRIIVSLPSSNNKHSFESE